MRSGAPFLDALCENWVIGPIQCDESDFVKIRAALTATPSLLETIPQQLALCQEELPAFSEQI